MFKKLLLLGLLFSFHSLYAFTFRGGALVTDSKFKNTMETDWVGVYKKGTSTAWKNVLKWYWVKDIKCDNPDNCHALSIEDLHLPEGSYHVRYMENNSYKISDEYQLHIEKNKKPKVFIKAHEYLNGNASIFLRYQYIDKISNKDWVAYYKKGTSTAWENVIKWYWVKDLKCSNPDDCHDVLPPEDLALGDYEVRLFKNNSFTTFGQPLSLHIRKVNSTLESISAYSRSKGTIHMDFSGLGKFLQPNPKDWIALYKHTDSNEWGNVVQWVWAKDINLGIHDQRYNQAYYQMKNIKPGKYEIRYFLNNSFSTYVKSKVFLVK
jgi:hypothetical protein